MLTTRYIVGVYVYRRMRIWAECGTRDNIGLKVMHSSVDTIVNNGDFDWRDLDWRALLLFLTGSVPQEYRKILDALDPWVSPEWY